MHHVNFVRQMERRAAPPRTPAEEMRAPTLAAGPGPRTAHQFVKDSLRRAILRGTLAGGARLVQADIAAELGVSITPVREALRDLATEGIVRIDPHRGAIVSEVSLDEVREIYRLRQLLEPIAAGLAAPRILAEDLEEAARLQAEMDGEIDRGRWVELNRAFHGVLLQATDSPRLSAIVRQLQDAATLYVAFSVKIRPLGLEGGNEEHRAILAAFRARDAGAVRQAVRRHLRSTLESIEVGRRA